MLIGALLSAAGVGLLITATSSWDILLFGGLMAVGSATFSTANWALVADLAPPAEAARFLGLANIGTAGAAAAAGLLGPVVDWANASSPGDGYTTLFVAAIVAFLASGLALRGLRGTSVIPTTSASTA
jgi:MFS family permease